jgi:hypothetical protein
MFPDELTLIEEQAASLEMVGAIDGVPRDPGRDMGLLQGERTSPSGVGTKCQKIGRGG